MRLSVLHTHVLTHTHTRARAHAHSHTHAFHPTTHQSIHTYNHAPHPHTADSGDGGALTSVLSLLETLKMDVSGVKADVTELTARLPADDATPFTPAGYEDLARKFLLETVLPQWLGLQVVRGASLERIQGEIRAGDGRSVQWDFRAPVTVANVPPASPSKSSNFVIYPSREQYARPEKPPSSVHLTPTKLPNATHPPAADFMSIFEVTIADKWADAKGSERESLLTRLEERLFISLARANALRSATSAVLNIVDVVAVVGVVGCFHCKNKIATVRAASMADASVHPSSSGLLWQLMDAGRFVFVRLPYGDASIRS